MLLCGRAHKASRAPSQFFFLNITGLGFIGPFAVGFMLVKTIRLLLFPPYVILTRLVKMTNMPFGLRNPEQYEIHSGLHNPDNFDI